MKASVLARKRSPLRGAIAIVDRVLLAFAACSEVSRERVEIRRADRELACVAHGRELEEVPERIDEIDRRVPRRSEPPRPFDVKSCRAEARDPRVEVGWRYLEREVRVRTK